MAKRSSDPRVAYPDVTVQVRDLVRVVGIIDPLPHRESVFGENSIYRDPGCKWAQETYARCHPTSRGTTRESQAKFRDRTVSGL